MALAGTAESHEHAVHVMQSTEALSVSARPAAAVVDAFHAALRSGNSRAALALLANDVLIYESGEVERSKAEYASSHLAADVEFEQATSAITTARSGQVTENSAWIASVGRVSGTYKGKALNRLTTETMVLQKSGQQWRITHIHWSSAAVHMP